MYQPCRSALQKDFRVKEVLPCICSCTATVASLDSSAFYGCVYLLLWSIVLACYVQGSTLMGTVENTFDKMDVAIALHHRLIDQTQFATLLCCLECEEDRDNVWHRILTNKAHKQPACPAT